MKAIIMAGGEGSRLRPLTCELPKPMVPIMNIPIMEHIIGLLKSHGITQIGVTLMYLPQKIKDYFKDGSKFGVNLYYFTEDVPLGTAGSVKNAHDFLDETFIVISGDSLTNMDLTKAVHFHKQKRSMATLVLTRVAVPLEYGVVIIDSNEAVTGFVEKPSWGEIISDTVNTGTYILEPDILNFLTKGIKTDFSQDLFPKLLADKQPLFGHITSDYWCDIGDLRAYLQAHYDILEGKINININATKIRKGVWLGTNTIIAPDAKINGPCVIGDNCRIGNNSVIEEFSVLGTGNLVEDEATIKHSVIWNNNYIESGSQVRGSIICNKVNLKKYVSVFENTVIGDNCTINEYATIKPDIKIWPQKAVESSAVVDRNVVWGTKHLKSIFGENGLSGTINLDISPEFAARLGAAYGSMFKKGAKVVVSSTASNAARMFKHAFISGILSVGVEVFNIGGLLTPIARHAINFFSVEGGIHIKISGENPNKLWVDFMDSKGAGISRTLERKIENAYFREDFVRSSGEDISRLYNITDFKLYYSQSILNEIDTQMIREKAPKICLISPSDFVISIVTPMLTDIGCKVVSFSPANLDFIESIVETISKTNSDFAAFVDFNGETLRLMDKNGNIIEDDIFLALTSLIIFKSLHCTKVVVPITAPSVIDHLAKRYNGTVTRTKTSTHAVMEEMLNNNLINCHEGMSQFLLNFDALAGLVKIIEFLSVQNASLSEIINEIPDFYTSKKSIFCPWELKGKVMRTLITEKHDEKVELLDGIKFISEDGWALILPDADLPLFRVFSEGNSYQSAEAISNKYIDKIRAIINSKELI